MALLFGLFLLVGIVLMLVLLEKNTGGQNGGIGCVSGAILFGIFLLVMQRSQELKNSGQPNPISTLESLLAALPRVLTWGAGLIVGFAVVAGTGWLIHVTVQREADRKSEREQWLNTLAELSDHEFDIQVLAWRKELNAAFRSEDWAELRRRRGASKSVHSVGYLSPQASNWLDNTLYHLRWTPVAIVVAGLGYSCIVGLISYFQPAATKPQLTTTVDSPLKQVEGPRSSSKSSPADWMRDYEERKAGR